MTDVKLALRGLRGESFADVLRRTGEFGVLSTDTDAQAIAKVTADANEAAAVAEAFVSGILYDDTTDGLAGTSSGDYFTVAGGTGGAYATLYRNTAGSAVEVESLIGLGSFGFQGVNTFGSNIVIDPAVNGSWGVGVHDPSWTNKIGVNNTKPVTEPATGARATDTGYVSGSANLARIGGGYDNVLQGEACFIDSQHSMIYSGATHCYIKGGSLHTIHSVDYAGISDGSSCTIEGRCNYGQILGSDSCLLRDLGSTTASGFRGLIATSSSTTIGGRNSAAIGCLSLTLNATYSTALNLETSTITAGNHLLLGGANLTIGATGTPAYSLYWGEGITGIGSRVLCLGDGHTVAYDYTVTTGTKCISPFAGARVHSSRQRGGTAGNNMEVDFGCSQETTDTTTTRLSVAGSSSYPTLPVNSVFTGQVFVTGVKDDGTVSSFLLTFTAVMGASGAPTLKGLAATVIIDDLALPTDPTMNVTSTGIFRVQVVGLAATNIRWMASTGPHIAKW